MGGPDVNCYLDPGAFPMLSSGNMSVERKLISDQAAWNTKL